jgi:2-C-methyl-D-erythritol 4-phosphate cytidylyltransferase
MKMQCAALITAGGSGTRMGTAMPKQYLDVLGVPVLARTNLAFERHASIDFIIVTVPEGDEEQCRVKIVEAFGLSKVRRIVAGGGTRQESVYNGLQRLEDARIVTIHDGVRPLVSAETIEATIDAAIKTSAAVACVPVKETVKKQLETRLETVPREGLWLAHTPQTFERSLILEAYRAAAAEGYEGTDDAALVERLGRPVTVVEDSELNIKITTPADLRMGEIFLQAFPELNRSWV